MQLRSRVGSLLDCANTPRSPVIAMPPYMLILGFLRPEDLS